jgi:hypothetical protein
MQHLRPSPSKEQSFSGDKGLDWLRSKDGCIPQSIDHELVRVADSECNAKLFGLVGINPPGRHEYIGGILPA